VLSNLIVRCALVFRTVSPLSERAIAYYISFMTRT